MPKAKAKRKPTARNLMLASCKKRCTGETSQKEHNKLCDAYEKNGLEKAKTPADRRKVTATAAKARTKPCMISAKPKRRTA